MCCTVLSTLVRMLQRNKYNKLNFWSSFAMRALSIFTISQMNTMRRERETEKASIEKVSRILASFFRIESMAGAV